MAERIPSFPKISEQQIRQAASKLFSNQISLDKFHELVWGEPLPEAPKRRIRIPSKKIIRR